MIRLQLRLPRGRVLAVIALGVVIAALVTTSALLLSQEHQSNEVNAARASAQDASKTLVPHVLSYSYQTLDADVSTATGAATGNFKQNLQALMTQVVKPTATNDNVVTRATVTHSSVVEAQQDEVVLLVLLSQESTSRTQTTPVVSSSSARVQLHRVNGQWLVSDLQPL
jgi:Mce-associated membrane protein